jgi:FkbM family methyltransferase
MSTVNAIRNFVTRDQIGIRVARRAAKSIIMDCSASRALPPNIKKEVEQSVRKLYRIRDLPNPIDILGYKIRFLGQDHFRYLVNEIFLEGAYCFPADTNSPVIFDCGSNIGASVLFFKMLYPNAKITAFEPDPFTFAVLTENIAMNGLSNVSAHRGALSDSEGEIEFYRDESPESSSLLMSTIRERHAGRCIKVPTFKLSRFINSDIDLLKIDIEGAERAVLKDLIETDKLRCAKRIHLEYHHHIDTANDDMSSLFALMESQGFGYQLRANPWKWPVEREFQDVSLYFYKK